MRFLLDTQLILWLTIAPERLSPAACDIIQDRDHELFFSAVSIWEVAIKRALGRANFNVDPRELRAVLIDDACCELPFTSLHAIGIETLPSIHRDPFDRALLAQAGKEGLTLLTSDRELGRYPGTLRA